MAQGGPPLDDLQNGTKERRARQKLSRRIYWMPVIVLIVGLLSLALLMSTNKIDERLRMNFDLCDALMDIQIKVATSHLWLEEAVSGDHTVDIQKVKGEIDLAMSLTEAILSGGNSEHGLPLEPLTDSKLRSRVEEVKSLLTDFRTTALKRIENPGASGTGSILDQHFDKVFEQFQVKVNALEKLLEGNLIRSRGNWRRLFTVTLLAWTGIVFASAIGLWSRESRRKAAEEGLEKAKDQLEIKVTERTKELRNANDRLRYLSSQLLTAQENERKRISGDLHDGLGQSLASLKHQLYRVQTKVKEEKMELGNECEESLQNVAQIIEHVRRFSRDLSSHTLEYCGLSVALRSLIDDFIHNYDLDVTHDIIDMNSLVSKEAHIVIYRIFQEVLNNIGKHAQATRLSVAANREDSRISFFFEDNGKGFDINHTILGNTTGKGLGLAILNERVRMLSGSLNLHSEKGKGTRISFTIPMNQLQE